MYTMKISLQTEEKGQLILCFQSFSKLLQILMDLKKQQFCSYQRAHKLVEERVLIKKKKKRADNDK